MRAGLIPTRTPPWSGTLAIGNVAIRSTSHHHRHKNVVQAVDKDELQRLLGPQYLRPAYDTYSDAHVDDLVEAAAGLISVIDELRPLDPATFNPAYEIWKAIAAVPPADRVRILEELEPGAIFSLWRSTVSRYVLDEQRSKELFSDFFIWDDFPSKPGEVITYEGVCEQFYYRKGKDPLGVDQSLQAKYPRTVPWLKPTPSTLATPQDRFKQQFFLSNRTGLLHSRLLLDTSGPLKLLTWLAPPVYNRVEINTTLVPASSDAGADITLTYPMDAALLKQQHDAGVALIQADLPHPSWPKPLTSAAWSPLSFSSRDFMRAAGPGFYVGCAYRSDEKGTLLEEEHVYFALVRTH